MFDSEGSHQGTRPLIVDEDVWLANNIEEICPMICHILPELLGQDDWVLEVSELKIDLAHHYRVNELFLVEHLVALSSLYELMAMEIDVLGQQFLVV
jgi:hypothetical protein